VSKHFFSDYNREAKLYLALFGGRSVKMGGVIPARTFTYFLNIHEAFHIFFSFLNYIAIAFLLALLFSTEVISHIGYFRASLKTYK
jgi:hypothetical protein